MQTEYERVREEADRRGMTVGDIATERASVYAPPPRYDPLPAGFVGFCCAGAGAKLFTLFTYLRPTYANTKATQFAAVVGVIVFAWFWFIERTHHRAWSDEYGRIMQSAPADKRPKH